MELVACGHPARVGRSRLCPHLLGEAGEDHDRVWLLTGAGLEHDLCCAGCAASGGPVELIAACEGCVDRVDADCEFTAFHGRPGIAERPEPVDRTLTHTRMPLAPLDIAPVPDRAGEWLLLGRGRLLHWNADTGETIRGRRLRIPASGVDKPWSNREPRPRVLAAPGGRFAAVVVDYGRRGRVVDLDRLAVTMRLDRGRYYPQTTPFPVAFATVDGAVLVVHATDWNRLDLSDPATGALLTSRATAWPANKPRPAHHLDYFHGRLHVSYPAPHPPTGSPGSPDSQWIADDGWVWAPVGVPTVWNLRRWRLRNGWESEDGSSRQSLCQRAYHWDSPMCWIDEERLAVSGIGADDLVLIPGVRVFDPVTGAETGRFAGPSGPLHSDGTRLYSSDSAGLQVWDPDTGERTGRIPGFLPTHHHPAGRELVAVDGSTLVRWRML